MLTSGLIPRKYARVLFGPRSPHGLTAPPLTRLARPHVAILGGSQSHEGQRLDYPDGQDWEVWSCNSLWPVACDAEGRFRADRWFELHPMTVQTPAELAAIQACPIPIYVTEDPRPDGVPSGVSYPRQAVREAFPGGAYASTFAWQMALALLWGAERIGIYGGELWRGTLRERVVEMGNLSYWLGVAHGRRVPVDLPPGSWIGRHLGDYGFDYHAEAAGVEQEILAPIAWMGAEWAPAFGADWRHPELAQLYPLVEIEVQGSPTVSPIFKHRVDAAPH